MKTRHAIVGQSWFKSKLLAGTGICLCLVGAMASCGTRDPKSSAMVQLVNREGTVNKTGADASSSKLVFAFDAAPPTAEVKSAFSSLNLLTFLDNTVMSATSLTESVVVSFASDTASLKRITLPAFAQSKTFLPLDAAASDFWLVEKTSANVKVMRPTKAVASPLPAALPEHMLASLPADSSPVGFGRDVLILKTSSALWIVLRKDKELLSTSVGFPNPSSSPVAAGQVSGSSNALWIADSSAIWLLTPTGSDWSAKKIPFEFKNASGVLSKLAVVLSQSGGALKLSGPALALFGSNLHTLSLKISKVALESTSTASPAPSASPTATPTPTVTAMTFAEAQVFCNGCHATGSGNTNALNSLSGTQNVATWTNNRTAIVASIRDNVMPLGRTLTETERARLLLFANDPKP